MGKPEGDGAPGVIPIEYASASAVIEEEEDEPAERGGGGGGVVVDLEAGVGFFFIVTLFRG